jgi:hypothetical protein
MSGKYAPLRRYLASRTGVERLSFAQIERVLGDALPLSARRHAAWWSNEAEGRHVQAHAWMDAGWRVESVDLEAAEVVFGKRASPR